MKIRVLLVDDHKILRDGLRNLLETKLFVDTIDEAESGREAIELARTHPPDLVIMDIHMQGTNGIEATREIKKLLPSVKVIALSMHSDRRFVEQMLAAGASAYLLKDCAFEELERCIRSVRDNKTYISPGIAGDVIREYVNEGEASRGPGALTDRERTILQLIAEGRSTKEIAAYLNLSTKTVETHRQHIMQKLNLFTLPDLTKYAIREGIISLDS